jgi:acetyltransferase-like isoleucine patch superfamily enzyme
VHKRLILIGGGKGAQMTLQYVTELREEEAAVCHSHITPQLYGILDQKDGPDVIGKPFEWIPEDDAEYTFFCTGSRDMRFRRKAFEFYRQYGEFLNVLESEIKSVGQGNFVFEGVTFGRFSTLGDNNVVSCGCHFGHHNEIGSGNLFGPGCMTSGTVKIGDNCDFGAGVIVQPRVTIGDGCRIASGTVIVKNLLPGTDVKAEFLGGFSVFQGGRRVRSGNSN